MNNWQKMVEDFHRAFDIKIGDLKAPGIDEESLRLALITEEVVEFGNALRRRDFPETIDALCDIIYVVLGTAVTFGIDLQPFFSEVHRANMAKVGGEKRSDGKHLKPAGWTPPDIDAVLKLQVELAKCGK